MTSPAPSAPPSAPRNELSPSAAFAARSKNARTTGATSPWAKMLCAPPRPSGAAARTFWPRGAAGARHVRWTKASWRRAALRATLAAQHGPHASPDPSAASGVGRWLGKLSTHQSRKTISHTNQFSPQRVAVQTAVPTGGWNGMPGTAEYFGNVSFKRSPKKSRFAPTAPQQRK